MRMRRWTVGVDFGGTNVKLGLVDPRGRIAATQALSSRVLSRPPRFVEGVARAVETLSRAAGVRPSQLRGVGVGAPGPVDVERGLVHFLVNVPGWREVPLSRALERRLHCRCVIDNDVNVFALGEWRFGAGRGAHNLVCLTLGTGVGGGLMFNGLLYRGSGGAAGELGHMVINPRGNRCGCGARGCLEAEVGTAAILRMGRRAIREGAEPLTTLARAAHGHLTPELISEAARRGDARARRIWVEVGRWLGVGLANVANLLNPDRIVIGGGVANAWGHFAPTMRRTVRQQALAVSARAAHIVQARFGNHAGIVGAAVLVWNETGSVAR